MSYEFYKILHITSIVAFFMTVGVTLFGIKEKNLKIVAGISTLVILVSGMGLAARLGLGKDIAWPNWIFFKFFLWLLLGSLGPIVAKRMPHLGKKVFWFYLFALALAVTIVQYKP